MERMNDDTIRLRISQEDMDKRGVDFLDMMMNQGEVEDFFFSILDEINDTEDFTDTDMVSFQIIPHANGLEAFITKGNDAQFPMQFLQERLQNMPGLAPEFFDDEMEKSSEQPVMLPVDVYPKNYSAVIRFDDFEKVIHWANNVRFLLCQSSLHTINEKFYLLFESSGDENVEIDFFEDCAKAYEYGEKTWIKADLLREHAKELIGQNALEVMKDSFKK